MNKEPTTLTIETMLTLCSFGHADNVGEWIDEAQKNGDDERVEKLKQLKEMRNALKRTKRFKPTPRRWYGRDENGNWTEFNRRGFATRHNLKWVNRNE